VTTNVSEYRGKRLTTYPTRKTQRAPDPARLDVRGDA
jgi:hypothetical protein